LGAVEIIDLLTFVSSIALWQLHVKAGISIIWSLAAGCIGLVLAIVGGAGKNLGPNT
jgi:hypothetical protein